MSKDITIEILKKDNTAVYPNHISVKQHSTNEFVHLYFDEGNLKRMTYPIHNPKQEKDELKADYRFQDGQIQSISSDENLPRKVFFVRTMSPVKQTRKILFFDEDGVAASIKMDMNGQCLPDYIDNHHAEVSYVEEISKIPVSNQKKAAEASHPQHERE